MIFDMPKTDVYLLEESNKILAINVGNQILVALIMEFLCCVVVHSFFLRFCAFHAAERDYHNYERIYTVESDPVYTSE